MTSRSPGPGLSMMGFSKAIPITMTKGGKDPLYVIYITYIIQYIYIIRKIYMQYIQFIYIYCIYLGSYDSNIQVFFALFKLCIFKRLNWRSKHALSASW